MKGPKRGLRPEDPHGICIVDKPAGWTSHDVVARTRSLLDTPKVGHAGTLDPMATGVLVLGVGKATRLLRYVSDGTKTYEARITFGVATDTLDAEGQVTGRYDMGDLDPARVAAAARTLTGDIQQVPPMVSALKVEGRRLHELARAGVEVERRPRPVHVARFDVTPTSDPLTFDALVVCSAGTYVRSLAADLGQALGGGAHLSALRRTAVGDFRLEQARPVDQPELLPVREAVRSLESVTVPAELAARVARGAVLEAAELGIGGHGPWAVESPEGDLLAVYESFRAGTVKPAVVLSSGSAG